ncbi:zinc finger, CCHC-type containing protein [Tanacetum coccineum]
MNTFISPRDEDEEADQVDPTNHQRDQDIKKPPNPYARPVSNKFCRCQKAGHTSSQCRASKLVNVANEMNCTKNMRIKNVPSPEDVLDKKEDDQGEHILMLSASFGIRARAMVLMVERNRGEHLIHRFPGRDNEPDPRDVKIDTDNEKEESMSVYDTDIKDVIEEEKGFVGKGGFGREDNIKDVVSLPVMRMGTLCDNVVARHHALSLLPPYRHPPRSKGRRFARSLGQQHAMLIIGVNTNSNNFDEHYCVVKNTHGETWGDGGKSRVAFEVFEYVMFPVYKGQEERDKEEREKKERQEKKREKKEKEKEEGNKVEEISEGSDAGGGGSVKMRKMVEDEPDGGDDGGVAGGGGSIKKRKKVEEEPGGGDGAAAGGSIKKRKQVDDEPAGGDDGDDDGDTSIKKNEQEKEKSGGEGGDKEEPGVGVVAYVQSSE